MKYAKAITRIILTISVLVFIIWAMVSVPKRACDSIAVAPHTGNESVLLDQQDIERMLAADSIAVIGKPMKEVNVEQITRLLTKNPYVKKVNFVHFSGRRLLIDFDLKNIILHVYPADGDQYFVDDEGGLVPYTAKMQDYLTVANGNIRQHYKSGDTARKELRQIVNIVKAVNADKFSRAQFKQVYLNDKNQVELVSTLGNQLVLVGDDRNIEEKLANVRDVYREGITRKGFDTYAQLDARFKNRVIAKRK